MNSPRLTALSLLLLFALAPRLSGAEPRRVLLLHSFGRDFAPFNSFAGGFRTELARRSPEPVDVFEASLESARFNEAEQDHPFVDYLHTLFEGRQLDLVVPIGGPAVRFIQHHRQRLFSSVPMLIAASDERHLQLDALTPEDALVLVRNDPVRMLGHLLELLPQTTNVAVVIGDSPLERFWLGEVQRDFQPFTNRLTPIWLNGQSFSRILDRCATLPPRSAILFVIMYVDGNGVPHLENRALSRLRSAANAPIFGLHETQLGRGIVGGPLMEIDDLANNAAHAAIRILGGESPADVRLPAQNPGVPQYDWRELQRWGIPETRLPPGSKVLLRQPNVWEQHRGRIITFFSLFVAEAGLIVLLAANLVRRRRAERSLRESEQRLSLAAAAGNLGVWIWDVARNDVWATPDWHRMFGFPPEIRLDYQTILQRIHPEDRCAVDLAVRRTLDDHSDYVGEFRIQLPDGTQRWVATQSRVRVTTKLKSIRLLGATVDITERKRTEAAARDLSRRLITAQEQERSRLARELHDDITQRLARLAIDVSLCESATQGTSEAEIARGIREGLVRLSEDVHSLSYRLHPSMLDDLGLATALRAECDRFSQGSQLQIKMTLDDLPEPVAGETALALFRVAQEALRNAARHAQARNLQLSLRAMDGGLQLAVQDDGQGFDPVKHRDHPSLGLASMRERIELLGGEFDLESIPGHGTTILAWIPLAKRPESQFSNAAP